MLPDVEEVGGMTLLKLLYIQRENHISKIFLKRKRYKFCSSFNYQLYSGDVPEYCE